MGRGEFLGGDTRDEGSRIFGQITRDFEEQSRNGGWVGGTRRTEGVRVVGEKKFATDYYVKKTAPLKKVQEWIMEQNKNLAPNEQIPREK